MMKECVAQCISYSHHTRERTNERPEVGGMSDQASRGNQFLGLPCLSQRRTTIAPIIQDGVYEDDMSSGRIRKREMTAAMHAVGHVTALTHWRLSSLSDAVQIWGVVDEGRLLRLSNITKIVSID